MGRKIEDDVLSLRSLHNTNFLEPDGQSTTKNLNVYDKNLYFAILQELCFL